MWTQRSGLGDRVGFYTHIQVYSIAVPIPPICLNVLFIIAGQGSRTWHGPQKVELGVLSDRFTMGEVPQ